MTGRLQKQVPHLWVLAAFLMVTGWVLFAQRDPAVPLASDEYIVGTEILKRDDPGGFAQDPMIHGLHYPKLYLYLPLLKTFWSLSGNFEQAHHWMLGLFALLQLIGFYALLYGLTRHAPASALVSIFTLANRFCPGWDLWGVYHMYGATGRSLFMPLGLLMILGFIHWRDNPTRVRWLFLAVGLSAIVHPVSVLWLSQILLLSVFLYRGVTLRSIALSLLDALCFLIGCLPLILSMNRLTSAGHEPFHASFEKIMEVCRYRWSWAFYPMEPEQLKLTLAHLAPPLLLAIFGLRCRVRSGTDSSDRWLGWFAGAAVALSLGEPALQQLYCAWTSKFPPMLEQFRGFRFLYVVLFIYIARLAVSLLESRLAVWQRTIATALVTGCIYVGPDQINLILPASLKVRVDWVMGTPPTASTSSWDTSYWVPNAPFRDLCSWARTQTPADSLFLFDNPMFRFYARRGAVGSFKDASFAVVLGPKSLFDWYDKHLPVAAGYKQQDWGSLLKLASNYGASYAVFPANTTVPGAERIFQNDTFAVFKAAAAR